MSVAKIVYDNIQPIVNFCNANPKAFTQLLDLQRSKVLFDLNYSFFIETKNINDAVLKTSSARYKADVFQVCNKSVRITNDWCRRNIPYLQNYFANNNLTPSVPISLVNNGANSANMRAKRSTRKNSRYKGNAIGNAQNLLVRNILSNLGEESFSEADWEETIKYFDNKCTYCGTVADLIMEHAIPINREKLGEHKLGNIVPSCNDCNRKKGDKDYREFLGDNLEAIRFIDKYMESRKYTPLEDDEKLKKVLDVAYEEVSTVADRYIDIINNLFSTSIHQEGV